VLRRRLARKRVLGASSGDDGEAMTLGQQILAARDRAELLANPTRHREVMW
jgi:hypothetical protein